MTDQDGYIAFPTRSQSHQLEELSERKFRECLPKNWTADKPSHDYGVDLRVDIFEEDKATGLELLVQLKSSSQAEDGDTVTIQLKTATYNLLWNKLQVAMLVKYVESEKTAYWILLKDVPVPSQKNQTFTVHIPKENNLESIDWQAIQDHVRLVTDKKLAIMRIHELEANKA